MTRNQWVDEFPGAVTVCDLDGIILAMNHKAARGFEADGGRELIGKNMLDCHPEPARTKTEQLLKSRQRNVYTIEKKGVKTDLSIPDLLPWKVRWLCRAFA